MTTPWCSRCGTNGTRRGPNRNALDALSYSTLINAPEGTTALAAEVMIRLPSPRDSSVVTCAEFRIGYQHARAEAVGASSGAPAATGLKLSTGEVAEFLAEAWLTATDMLPAVVSANPASMHWADPPAVELRLTAEHRADSTPDSPPLLDDYIDLSPLGRSDRGQLSEMGVTIVAPLPLDHSARRSLTRRALVHMTQQFGFLDATGEHF